MKKIITTYFTLEILIQSAMALTFTTYVVYMLENNLSLFQTTVCNAFYFITIFAFEIPTGVFADRFKKKYSVQAGFVFLTLGLLIFTQATRIEIFILAEIISAIGSAFVSGAFMAWLVNEIKYQGYDFELNRNKLMKKIGVVKQSVFIIAGAIGAIIASYDLIYPWIGGFVLALIATILSFVLMDEHSHDQEVKIYPDYKKILKESIKISRDNKNIKFVLCLAFIFYFSIMSVNMLWQPYITNRLNLDVSYLGVAWVLMSIFMLIGTWSSDKLHKYIKSEEMLIISLVLYIGIVMSVIIFVPAAVGIGVYLLHQFGRGAFQTIECSYTQSHFNDKHRATLGSIQSVVKTLAGSMGLLVSGFVASSVSIEGAWLLSGAIFIGGAMFLKKKFVV